MPKVCSWDISLHLRTIKVAVTVIACSGREGSSIKLWRPGCARWGECDFSERQACWAGCVIAWPPGVCVDWTYVRKRKSTIIASWLITHCRRQVQHSSWYPDADSCNLSWLKDSKKRNLPKKYHIALSPNCSSHPTQHYTRIRISCSIHLWHLLELELPRSLCSGQVEAALKVLHMLLRGLIHR